MYIAKVNTVDEFFDHCRGHGGNWTAMLLSGIKSIDPALFSRMPNILYTFDEAEWIANHLINERIELCTPYQVSATRLWWWADSTPHYRDMSEREKDMSIEELCNVLEHIAEECDS